LIEDFFKFFNLFHDTNVDEFLDIITKHQKLSEKFMHKIIDVIGVRKLLNGQKVSEKFLNDFSNRFNYVDWGIISLEQIVSEEFIIKYIDSIHLSRLFHKNQRFSEELLNIILKKFDDKTNIERNIIIFKIIRNQPNLTEKFILKLLSKLEKCDYEKFINTILENQSNINDDFLISIIKLKTPNLIQENIDYWLALLRNKKYKHNPLSLKLIVNFYLMFKRF
jgi:hypothetical protein